MRQLLRYPLVGLFLLASLPTRAGDLPDPNAEPAAFLQATVERLCRPAQEMPAALAGSELAETAPVVRGGQAIGVRRRFTLAGGGELRALRLAPGGLLRRFETTLFQSEAGRQVPVMTLQAGPACVFVGARKLILGPDGWPDRLEILDGKLQPIGSGEALDPPVPPGQARPGLRIALVDSGVNYQLDPIARRLARDSDGNLVGYDYWELDPRPFDSNPARSAFFPQRHGTRVASVLLREAPGTRLVPYRYPRPDLGRMADLVAAAVAAGVRILALPLGSKRREDWVAFEAAAEARPELLFVVSAGNNGRDIDAAPVYPAALPLENILVVTSSERDGRLARGSNWGAESVDLMVPAEEMAVTEFDGRPGRASGSSYAVPRIAALAARLLSEHPDWTAAEIKAAILARAEPGPESGLTKHGWIADPRR